MAFAPILSPVTFPFIPAELIIDEIILISHSLDDTIDWLKAHELLAQSMK